MKEIIVRKIAELKGRRTTMEIVEVKHGDRTYNREIVHRPQASVAIIKVMGTKGFVLIKQFRTAIQKTIIEAVAGVVDEGETPLEAIYREVEEETGYKVELCKCLSSFYVSPGYSDEIIHAFYVEVNPNVGKQSLDDTERVNVAHFEEKQIDQFLSEGIVDGKTVLAWMAYKIQRVGGV
jgi:ADP-ribose pyrophosphatase